MKDKKKSEAKVSEGQKSSVLLGKRELKNKIDCIEGVLGLEKRMKREGLERTVAEIDMEPMSANAFDMQNILLDYCGITRQNQYDGKKISDGTLSKNRIEKLFGKIRALPKKACTI